MKFLLTYFLSVLILFATELSPEHNKVVLIEKILGELSIKKEIKIWSDNKEILSEIKNHNNYKTVQNCENATIIILENRDKLIKVCSNKHIFVLNYQLLSDLPQSFGALFWKKGRPNIVIIEPRIKAQSIKAKESLDPYLEEKVW